MELAGSAGEAKTLLPDELGRIDSICDRFEASLRTGDGVSIEELLEESASEAFQVALFGELLKIELELSSDRKQSLEINDYLRRFPKYSKLVRAAFADVVSEVDQDKTTSRPSENAPDRKQQIGPYRLLQVIGEGGMGSVWMAEQTKPIRRRVALKIIKSGLDNRHAIARFESERQALAWMNHTNEASVFA